jgi:hypothetical protein
MSLVCAEGIMTQPLQGIPPAGQTITYLLALKSEDKNSVVSRFVETVKTIQRARRCKRHGKGNSATKASEDKKKLNGILLLECTSGSCGT